MVGGKRMVYCINCGREIKENHRYCAVCGADQYPNENYSDYTDRKALKDNDKALAIISYIGILSLVSYFVAPKTSSYARFHAVQGLNLFIFECIFGVSRGILSGIFSWVWPIRTVINSMMSLAGVGLLVLAIVGLVYASKGEMKQLPVVGSWKIVKD
jgi:uncharacterized membrane protein